MVLEVDYYAILSIYIPIYVFYRENDTSGPRAAAEFGYSRRSPVRY
jgi:hypothetical protein